MSASIRVGIVPASPVLVPAVGGHQPELDPVRATVLACCRWVVGSSPRRVLVLATATVGSWGRDARWNLRGFGLTGPSAYGPGDGPDLPWPLGVGACWLDAAGWTGDRRYRGVDAPVELDLAAAEALLVVGDGNVARSETAMPEEAERRVRRRLVHAFEAGDGEELVAVSDPPPSPVTAGSGWAGWASLGRAVRRPGAVARRQVHETVVDGVHLVTAGWELAAQGSGPGSPGRAMLGR